MWDVRSREPRGILLINVNVVLDLAGLQTSPSASGRRTPLVAPQFLDWEWLTLSLVRGRSIHRIVTVFRPEVR